MSYCQDLYCYAFRSQCNLHENVVDNVQKLNVASNSTNVQDNYSNNESLNAPTYVLGVDVGGTNTDCVCMRLVGSQKEVIANIKTQTTSDVSIGIMNGIKHVLEMANCSHKVKPLDIFSVTIGTTHYVNAVIQRKGLQKVAVFRLCGEAGTSFPPLCDWPLELKKKVEGPTFFLPGGYEVSGKTAPLAIFDPEMVREAVRATKAHNDVNSFVVIGVFSGSDDNEQERECGRIIEEEWRKLDSFTPVYVTLASQVLSPMGLLERENAAVLNASLCSMANKTITGFKRALMSLGLSNIKSRFFMSQNDGTVVLAETCRKLPILTFASGPTNTMRGAGFLTGLNSAVVVDLGGTTMDVGLLVNGFPRPKLRESTLAGVRVSYPIPDTLSMGLGGGTIVRYDQHSHSVTLGPDSVGHRLSELAQCFGGDVLTLTDIMVYLNADPKSFAYGKVPPIVLTDGVQPNPSLVRVNSDVVKLVICQIRIMVERGVDRMKTSPDPIPLLVCGGGSILLYALGTLDQQITLSPYNGSLSVSEVHGVRIAGVSCVLIPTHFGVVNAVGAAISQISGTVSEIVAIPKQLALGADADSLQANQCARGAVIDRLKSLALARAVAAGADASRCNVTEFVEEALTYVEGMSRFFIKVTGEWDPLSQDRLTADHDATIVEASDDQIDERKSEVDTPDDSSSNGNNDDDEKPDLESYKPTFDHSGAWVLTETDLQFIAEGAGILGCGGGGSAYLGLLRGRLALKEGKKMTVVDPRRVSGDCSVASFAFFGAPAVMPELLANGKEMKASLQAANLEKKCTHVISLEAGGFNCIEPLVVGAELGLPVLDADGMGRAFPTLMQVVWFAKDGSVLQTCGMASYKGEGQTIPRENADGVMDMQMKMLGYAVRSGMMAGCCIPGLPLPSILDGPLNSISLAWSLGRAMGVARSRKQDPVEAVRQAGNGLILFVGKVVRKEKITEGGYDKGRLWIEEDCLIPSTPSTSMSPRVLRVEFQNEYLVAFDELQCVASCPDLITIIDVATARAMQTEEIVYGLQVAVLVLPANPALTDAKLLPFTAPAFFGFQDVRYQPAFTRANSWPSVFDLYGSDPQA